MKPAPFVYYAPASIEEAVAVLAEVAHDDGRVLAGGQTLVPAMALRLARPAHLVDINRIAALHRLSVIDGQLEIGACVRHGAFDVYVEDGPLGHLLSAVVRHIAHLPIRTRGTFCGSVANADPASEWCLASVTLDATFIARSVRGERQLKASEFFLGYMTTALEHDELLVAARIPLLPRGTRFGFEEVSRRKGDFAQAMSLVTWTMADGRLSSVRVGVGGVEASPRRLSEVEAILEGARVDEALFERAAQTAADVVEPTEGNVDAAAYKRDLVRAVVHRASMKAKAIASELAKSA
jgi:carbon-monoxide dehydrogenase medium subunit